MDIYFTLVTLHVAGTILGVGGATFIEVFLNKSLSDGKMDETEKGFMKLTYTVLRTGLALSFITGLGFVALYYANGQTQRLLNPVFWAKNTIILTLVVNSVLLHYHVMKLRWGSSLSFVSWWAAALLGLFLTNNSRHGYIEIMAVYGVAVVAGAFVLEWVRSLTKRPSPPVTAMPPQQK